VACQQQLPQAGLLGAHLFGKPKAWTEGGGELGIDGKFQLDYQLVRGLNAMQIRVPLRTAIGGEQPWRPLVHRPLCRRRLPCWRVHRPRRLSDGYRTPRGAGGLYHPTNSMWMGDEEAEPSTTKLGWQLLEHQVDWDYFDEQSLSSVATIADGGFKNLSGQVYRAIVVPPSTVITRTGLERSRRSSKPAAR